MKRISWPLFTLMIIAIGLVAWISDRITLQGERTIYTADCQTGKWQGGTCTGSLAAGDRFRFRALKSHGEVVFWIVGSTTVPSGKFSDCAIKDGKNWRCNANAEFPRSITREMAGGIPVTDVPGQALPFHQIPKWRWLLLKLRVPTGKEVG